jgi:hypothetical protein
MVVSQWMLSSFTIRRVVGHFRKPVRPTAWLSGFELSVDLRCGAGFSAQISSGCMERTLLPKIRRRISGGSSKETIEIRRILERQFIGNLGHAKRGMEQQALRFQ